MVRKTTKLGNFETLESKKLMTADLGVEMPIEFAKTAEVDSAKTGDAEHTLQTAEIEFVEVGGGEADGKPVCYLKYKLDRAFIKSWSISGDADAPLPGEVYVNIPMEDTAHFVADSFSFGVEREMKESGEKGGTEDINIGIGELQECTISKSMDTATAKLAQFAINGNSCSVAEIDFVEVGGSGGAEQSGVYLSFELPKGFEKSWSITGDADDRPTEEVAFYYNKLCFAYPAVLAGGSFEASSMSWDNVKNIPWDTANSGPVGDSGFVDAAMESWGENDAQAAEEVAFYFNKITN